MGGGVAVEGDGNTFISGWTSGSLDGSSSGYSDVFLAKYAVRGNLQWFRQLGRNGTDDG